MRTITVRQTVAYDLAELSGLFDQYRVFQGKPSDIAAAHTFLQARFDHHESIVFMPMGIACRWGLRSFIRAFRPLR